MPTRGVLRCLLAAALFGASAPAASRLAGEVPAPTLAGLLYAGAALAVLPACARTPPPRRALRASGRPLAVAVLAGGALGPVLLVAGLARTEAATASILLNLELVATVALAATLWREHLGGRVLGGAALVAVGGAVLVWTPGASLDAGALLVVAACTCWGVDNCVTARLDQLAPEHVVLAKGLVAGGADLLLGLLVLGGGLTTGQLVSGLAIGAAGYGWSITLWVEGAQELGAARAQVIFATAPFIGAALAWAVLGEPVAVAEVAAILLAGLGVAVSLGSAHAHRHPHPPLDHDHEHGHDDGHHDHAHGRPAVGRHRHRHRHTPLVHAHPHVPDLHHQHEH